jgi:hypothetical protein
MRGARLSPVGKRISAEFSIHDELAKESDGKAGQTFFIGSQKFAPAPRFARYGAHPMGFFLWHWNQSDGIRYGSAILIGHLEVAGAAGGKIVAAMEMPPAAVLLLVHVYGCARGSVTDGKRHAG